MEFRFTFEATDTHVIKKLSVFINYYKSRINATVDHVDYGVSLDQYVVVYDARNPDFYKEFPGLYNCNDLTYYSKKYNYISITICCNNYNKFSNAGEDSSIEKICLAILKSIRISKRVRLKAFDRKSFYEDMVKLFLEEGWIRDPKLILPFESFF